MKKKLVIPFFLIISIFVSPCYSDNKNNPFISIEYKDNISISAFILIEEQVCDFFSGKQVTQFSRKKVSSRQKSLALRVQNHGDLHAWGAIQCNIEGQGPLTVEISSLSGNMSKGVTYLIPIPNIVPPHKEGNPEIKWDWIELNSY